MLGILGGMGPSATADFFTKLVAMTPAGCDQEHVPLLLSCLPQTPDRSAAILGTGPSPLPYLLLGLRRLIDAGALAIVVPCNSCHHWFDELQAASPAPILHIADAAIAALPEDSRPVALLATRGALQSGFYQRRLEARARTWWRPDPDSGQKAVDDAIAALPEDSRPVALLATRGALQSGFYQRRLEARARTWWRPDPDSGQKAVDDAIAAIKRADPAAAGEAMRAVWQQCAAAGVGTAIMGCTEIPLAAEHAPKPAFATIDTNLELARCALAHALERGWNRAGGTGTT